MSRESRNIRAKGSLLYEVRFHRPGRGKGTLDPGNLHGKASVRERTRGRRRAGRQESCPKAAVIFRRVSQGSGRDVRELQFRAFLLEPQGESVEDRAVQCPSHSGLRAVNQVHLPPVKGAETRRGGQFL